MEFKILPILIASLATFLVGFIWYNPKVFGSVWMKETGMTEEKAKKGNMIKIFGLTLIYSLMLAFALPSLVIHQMGAISMVGGPAMIESAKPTYAAFMADYVDAFRTYQHGAFHGFLAGLFIILPSVAINGLFEQKSWKYILINAGYWIVSLTIMGAIICGWK